MSEDVVPGLSVAERERLQAGRCPCGCEEPPRSVPEPAPEQPPLWGHGPYGGPNRRHPVLLTLACTTLADACVRAIWHDGFPHHSGCAAPECRFRQYELFQQQGHHTGSLISWRKQVIFGLPAGRNAGRRSHREAAALSAGVPLWELRDDLERVFAQMQRLASRLGVAHEDALGDVRRYVGTLCGQLAGG